MCIRASRRWRSQEEEEEERKNPRITKESLRRICKEQKLYLTPHLNDVLYLHYKGYSKIENLEEYTGLRCLWLENNGIDKIENLDNQKDLRSLYLHNNLIKEIENLEGACPLLDSLNLCHNSVSTIKNLSGLEHLHTLHISHNRLQDFADVEHLKECKELSCVDLQHNWLDDPSIVDIFEAMPSLRVLYLTGNPVIKKIPFYRKNLTVRCKKLTYLDDRPVFPKDRAAAEAWSEGGLEAEQACRKKWADEERAKIDESVKGLLALRDKAKAAKFREEMEALIPDATGQKEEESDEKGKKEKAEEEEDEEEDEEEEEEEDAEEEDAEAGESEPPRENMEAGDSEEIAHNGIIFPWNLESDVRSRNRNELGEGGRSLIVELPDPTQTETKQTKSIARKGAVDPEIKKKLEDALVSAEGLPEKNSEEQTVSGEEVPESSKEAPASDKELPKSSEEEGPVSGEELSEKPSEETPVSGEELPKRSEEVLVLVKELPKSSEEERPLSGEELSQKTSEQTRESPVSGEELPRSSEEEGPVLVKELPKTSEEKALVSGEELPKTSEEESTDREAKPAEEVVRPESSDVPKVPKVKKEIREEEGIEKGSLDNLIKEKQLAYEKYLKKAREEILPNISHFSFGKKEEEQEEVKSLGMEIEELLKIEMEEMLKAKASAKGQRGETEKKLTKETERQHQGVSGMDGGLGNHSGGGDAGVPEGRVPTEAPSSPPKVDGTLGLFDQSKLIDEKEATEVLDHGVKMVEELLHIGELPLKAKEVAESSSSDEEYQDPEEESVQGFAPVYPDTERNKLETQESEEYYSLVPEDDEGLQKETEVFETPDEEPGAAQPEVSAPEEPRRDTYKKDIISSIELQIVTEKGEEEPEPHED